MTNTPQLSKHQEGILQYATMQTMLGRDVSFKQKLDEYIETQIAQAEKRGEENMRAKTIEFIDNIKFESHYQEEERGFEFCQEHIKNFLSSL